MSDYELSICIATRNRAIFLKEMLESIVVQLEPAVEVVIVDGASSDDTGDLVGTYVRSKPQFKYFLELSNSGVDGGYDKAVELASGRYCWLLTDDDRLKPGAIRHVLSVLGGGDLVILNSEVRSLDFSILLQDSRFSFRGDKIYDARDVESFFVDCTYAMTFIGAIVIARSLWLARDRKPFYGSEFIHLGVIFQAPLSGAVRVVSDPLIVVRNGNANWGPRTFEVWAVKYPALIWSFPWLSSRAKAAVTSRRPWTDPRTLFYWRAAGAYSRIAYAQYIARCDWSLARFVALMVSWCPGHLACAVSILYLRLMRRSERLRMYDLVNGRYRGPVSTWLCRFLGIANLVERAESSLSGQG